MGDERRIGREALPVMLEGDYRYRQLIKGSSAVPDTAFQTCNPRLEANSHEALPDLLASLAEARSGKIAGRDAIVLPDVALRRKINPLSLDAKGGSQCRARFAGWPAR